MSELSRTPDLPIGHNRLHMPHGPGWYSPILDAIVVPSGDSEVEQHEAGHRASMVGGPGAFLTAFASISSLIGVSHHLLWRMTRIADEHGLFVSGQHLYDLKVANGPEVGTSDFEKALGYLRTIERAIADFWSWFEPLAELAAIHQAGGESAAALVSEVASHHDRSTLPLAWDMVQRIPNFSDQQLILESALALHPLVRISNEPPAVVSPARPRTLQGLRRMFDGWSGLLKSGYLHHGQVSPNELASMLGTNPQMMMASAGFGVNLRPIEERVQEMVARGLSVTTETMEAMDELTRMRPFTEPVDGVPLTPGIALLEMATLMLMDPDSTQGFSLMLLQHQNSRIQNLHQELSLGLELDFANESPIAAFAPIFASLIRRVQNPLAHLASEYNDLLSSLAEGDEINWTPDINAHLEEINSRMFRGMSTEDTSFLRFTWHKDASVTISINRSLVERGNDGGMYGILDGMDGNWWQHIALFEMVRDGLLFNSLVAAKQRKRLRCPFVRCQATPKDEPLCHSTDRSMGY